MDHAITVHDLLIFGGVTFAIIVVLIGIAAAVMVFLKSMNTDL